MKKFVGLFAYLCYRLFTLYNTRWFLTFWQLASLPATGTLFADFECSFNRRYNFKVNVVFLIFSFFCWGDNLVIEIDDI